MKEFFEWYSGFFGEEITKVAIAMWIVMFAFSLILLIVNYVFGGVSLYAIAKRRGLKARGLAWVPFGWTWLFGSVADQFERKTKGRDRHYRTGLLIGDIAASAALIAGIVIVIVAFANLFQETMLGDSADMAPVIDMLSAMLWFYVLMIPALVFSVFYYIALYRVYKSCSPKASGWLLALAILVSFGGLQVSIPLFCLRNKDDGFAEEDPAKADAEQRRLELYN